MAWTLGLAILLLLVLVVWTALGPRKAGPGVVNGGQQGAGRASSGDGVSGDGWVGLDPPGGGDRADLGQRRVPLPARAAGEDALAGERILGFPPGSDLGARAEGLRAVGLRVLGMDPRLGTIRVGGAEGDHLRLLEAWADSEGADLWPNFAVRTPTPPPSTASLRPVGRAGGTALGLRGGGGGGVRVAVVDTAISPSALAPGSGIRVFGEGTGTGAGHGTAVAGILLGSADGLPGLLPEVELMSFPILDGDGTADAHSLATAILDAVEAGAQIISLSLGGYGDAPYLRSAVEYAAARGVVLVAAAGNDARDGVLFPARYPTVVGVAALDADLRRAPFSNFGPGIGFGAPGVGVESVREDGLPIWFSGTSAAVPVLVAAVAEVMDFFPNLTAMEAVEVLARHADDKGPVGPDPYFGVGVPSGERVRESGQAGLTDLAVTDFWPVQTASTGNALAFTVTVQNRGQTVAGFTRLEVRINQSQPLVFNLGTLAPGQSTGALVTLPWSELGGAEGARVEAVVTQAGPALDDRPWNDGRVGQFTLNSP